jgi:hypothetical protein
MEFRGSECPVERLRYPISTSSDRGGKAGSGDGYECVKVGTRRSWKADDKFNGDHDAKAVKPELRALSVSSDLTYARTILMQEPPSERKTRSFVTVIQSKPQYIPFIAVILRSSAAFTTMARRRWSQHPSQRPSRWSRHRRQSARRSARRSGQVQPGRKRPGQMPAAQRVHPRQARKRPGPRGRTRPGPQGSRQRDQPEPRQQGRQEPRGRSAQRPAGRPARHWVQRARSAGTRLWAQARRSSGRWEPPTAARRSGMRVPLKGARRSVTR